MITETITWFTPEEKMPEFYHTLLVISDILSTDYRVYKAYHNTKAWVIDEEDVWTETVKYWCYVPKTLTAKS